MIRFPASSAVWTLDPMSGALNGEFLSHLPIQTNSEIAPFLATLTNQDGSEDKPSLVFDPVHNVLSFTHDVKRNPIMEQPVV